MRNVTTEISLSQEKVMEEGPYFTFQHSIEAFWRRRSGGRKTKMREKLREEKPKRKSQKNPFCMAFSYKKQLRLFECKKPLRIAFFFFCLLWTHFYFLHSSLLWMNSYSLLFELFLFFHS